MGTPDGRNPRIRQAALDACNRLTGIEFRAARPTAAGKGEGPTFVDAVPMQGDPVRFCLIDRPTLRAEAVGALADFGNRWPHPLLVAAPHVDPAAAERARALRLAFVDLAGNAYLHGPRLFVFVVGRRRPAKPRPTRAPRALTPTGLKVVFALLLRPDRVAAPLREIAAETGVALGTVAAVMEDLLARGHLTPQGLGETRLLERQRLVEDWALLYPVRLRPKLVRGRYAAPDAAWWETAQLARGRGVFGGEVAADRMTGQLKPARVTLYVWGAPGDVILANRLRPDERGAVEILEAFWRPIEDGDAARQTAPPLLVYADLIATGDPRNVEAARIVRDRYLRGPDNLT